MRKEARTRQYPIEILSPGEVRQILKAFHRGPCAIRDRALVAVLYRSGLRISEALALAEQDIDWTACSVRVMCGKGKKGRVVGIDPVALQYVQTWVRRRERLNLPYEAPLFCTITQRGELGPGQPLDRHNVNHMLRRISRRAGVSKRVHCHGFRHTMAAELARELVPTNIIQKQLGHSSLQTTSIYLDHISPEELTRTMAGRSWSR